MSEIGRLGALEVPSLVPLDPFCPSGEAVRMSGTRGSVYVAPDTPRVLGPNANPCGNPGQELNPGEPAPLRITHGPTSDRPIPRAAVIGAARGAARGFLRRSTDPRRKLASTRQTRGDATSLAADVCPQWKLSDGSLYSPARRQIFVSGFGRMGAKVDVRFTIGDFKPPTSAVLFGASKGETLG